ncbi:MAG: hypothetical protein Q8S73_40090 [Deltaproteobacteria bacterium]|nr:hypothetical protein [Myxococcales bacterium]MDP3220367.1 hypothetical protein [Deltaproteobacteria bacterium]
MNRTSDRGDVLRALRAFLPSIVCREVLASREGLKVARTGLRLQAARRLARLGVEHGFSVVIGSESFFPRRDRGKGGWCNGLHEMGRGPGYRNVYVAASALLAHQALEAERCGDEMAFGTVLAVPPCCRDFYDRNQDAAARVQNDFVPMTTAVPVARPSALLNLGAQYFDASLVSHFPCSLACEPSISLARANARLVASYDRTWLRDMLARMNRATLYTEYEGVFLLAQRRTHAVGDVVYTPDSTLGTARGRFERALACGSRIRISGEERVEVLRGDVTVATLRAKNLRLFAPVESTVAEAIA